MSYQCRCRSCGARNTLKRHPDDYVRDKKCTSCKAVNPYRVDWYRTLGEESKKNTCHCDGLHYPHRKGSSVWCREHPTGPTEEDYKMRYKL